MSLPSYIRYAIHSWWRFAWTPRPEGRNAILRTVWPHHAKRSGYHPVAMGLGVALPAHGMRLVPAGVSRRIVGEGLDAAYQIAFAMKIARRDRLLVVDGDFQLKLIEGIRRVTQVKIFAVFHQIPRVLKERIAEASPLLLDGAICLARCQIPVVQTMAPPGKTWFVPHGVDTEYFAPKASRSERPSVLCVGVHCRDFETLRKAADLITCSVKDASVRLVAPLDALPPGLNLGRVELVSDLDDSQLRDEYRSAWVVLLPLTDSTANNSLLEGMACGTAVVASDVGGIRDYADQECGALCPVGDADAHAAAVINLLRDSSRREAAGVAARLRAEVCAWPNVRERIRAFIETGDGNSNS